MIAPDMATLLAFVMTDAALPAELLTALLQRATEDTFNAITVDGDTSTSDTLLMFATGKAAGVPQIESLADRNLKPFRAALEDLLRNLAHQVVRDGEGARKFVEVRVSGAASKKSARRIGMAIANSPLVKTAVAGEDANWGRIVMAVGKAGEPADRDRLSVWFGDTRVAVNGERDPAYSEDVAAAYMKRGEIVIAVDVGVGKGKDTVWTCDLTHGYIDINGKYRS
jgi:glutamate N-acetyltransferase/amino-acid N-acetyltransferase